MPHDDQDEFEAKRLAMVADQLESRGIDDEAVLRAMRKVPRHLFLPKEIQEKAYDDQAIALGPGQSISQPYIVAHMLQSLNLKPNSKVLDVGTGSGYQTALLAEIAAEIFSIEIDEGLSRRAQKIIRDMNYQNVRFQIGDGNFGWPENAPFDAIVVSAACEKVPRDLVRQLALNGNLILPLGEEAQFLVRFQKTVDGLQTEDLGAVQFVMIKSTDEDHN